MHQRALHATFHAPAVRRRPHTRRRCVPPRADGSSPGPELSRRLFDSVGAWLVAHPAPLWVVNNPVKRWFATLTAGDYDAVAAAAELDAAIASDDIVVFSATYCPFSARVKQDLADRCIPYTAVETNVVQNGRALVAELGKKIGRTSIPSVFIAGVSVGGCNDGTPGLRPLIAAGGLPAALAKCSPAFVERRRALQAAGKCTLRDTV